MAHNPSNSTNALQTPSFIKSHLFAKQKKLQYVRKKPLSKERCTMMPQKVLSYTKTFKAQHKCGTARRWVQHIENRERNHGGNQINSFCQKNGLISSSSHESNTSQTIWAPLHSTYNFSWKNTRRKASPRKFFLFTWNLY